MSPIKNPVPAQQVVDAADELLKDINGADFCDPANTRDMLSRLGEVVCDLARQIRDLQESLRAVVRRDDPEHRAFARGREVRDR